MSYLLDIKFFQKTLFVVYSYAYIGKSLLQVD